MNESENENVGCADKPGKSKDSPTPDDTDFEPTAEMMIHDFDDETTLNDDDEDTNDEELADLEKEGEMPLEDLVKLYYGGGGEEGPSSKGESGENEKEIPEDEAPRRSLRSSGLLNADVSGSESSDDEDNLTLPEEERKKPRIGEEYQVTEIPDVLPNTNNKIQYGQEDERIWTPEKLPHEAVEEYLREIAIVSEACSRSDANAASFIQDNEDALFLLVQADNDPVEALKRYKSRPQPLSNEIVAWSEEECQAFENGLTAYGKDFFLIHMNKVSTKSVRDIVKFYYIWKKSERYDHFTAKTRLGKKKELLPASVTDYMDRLLDETDHATTSSILNHTSAHFLKYSLAAHSAALMEHLKELEGGHFSDDDHGLDDVLVEVGDGIATGAQSGSSSGASSSNSHKEIEINANNNNNEANLHELDQVVSDLVENSPGVS